MKQITPELAEWTKMFLMNGPELTDEKCDGWLSSKKEPETHIYKLLNMI